MLKKIIPFTFFLIALSSFSQDLLMQNGTFNQCSGVFYDSGGSTGNYSNNENLTITICADNAGDAVRINFTSFFTQDGIDILEIYDGN